MKGVETAPDGGTSEAKGALTVDRLKSVWNTGGAIVSWGLESP